MKTDLHKHSISVLKNAKFTRTKNNCTNEHLTIDLYLWTITVTTTFPGLEPCSEGIIIEVVNLKHIYENDSHPNTRFLSKSLLLIRDGMSAIFHSLKKY